MDVSVRRELFGLGMDVSLIGIVPSKIFAYPQKRLVMECVIDYAFLEEMAFIVPKMLPKLFPDACAGLDIFDMSNLHTNVDVTFIVFFNVFY